MSEAEAIINGQPLTPISDDPKDVECLTPNHLLLLKSNQSMSPGVFDKQDLYSVRRWRQVQFLANLFWKRWSKEYLPTLQKRNKWADPRLNFAIGDLVLVVDERMPRGQWPLARLTEIYPDKTGHVRSVKVRTKSTSLSRPITKLCFLEVTARD